MISDWKASLLKHVRARVADDRYWSARLEAQAQGTVSLHLAVFVEPFLQHVVDGDKTLESRFMKHPIPPFGCVKHGDVVALKRASGPVVAVCDVGRVWEHRVTPSVLRTLRNNFADSLCATDPGFWVAHADKQFAVLMQIRRVKRLDEPFHVSKRDRRGWVVVSSAANVLPFGRQ